MKDPKDMTADDFRQHLEKVRQSIQSLENEKTAIDQRLAIIDSMLSVGRILEAASQLAIERAEAEKAGAS